MHPTPSPDTILVASHTTAAAASVAHWVERHYGLPVQQCYLIRRNLNDNYAVRTADGSRYVARLCAIRPRGPFNVDFEVALLAHLEAQGVVVASPVLAANGMTSVTLPFPEGPRALVLLRHCDGAVPDTPEDLHLTGATLAQIHSAAQSYAGPASRYVLDGHHLAGRTLDYLAAHPDLDSAVLDAYRQLIERLLRELADVEGTLTHVMCHGDTHGFNNHVTTDAEGVRRAAFFDFDDAGPGFLTYDLCVFLWSNLPRKDPMEPDEALLKRWQQYLAGYRAGGGLVTDADLAALPLFLQLRHLWNMGEGVARIHHWGANMMSANWIKKQPDVLAAWARLELPRG
ncbi:phosphotransferase [Acidovorax sp. FHTAMBA]|uniref:phosphotransferase enzyme family protein n=1 Tax=Acidovorax sp. FHTAMBA TaxID=3140252 RepID=UPI003184191C